MSERMADRRRCDGHSGFTLVELLVVIVILGVLSAVVVFAVRGVGDKGQASACKADTRTLRTAEEAYFASTTGGNGSYSIDEELLVAKGFLSEPSSLHKVRLVADVNPATAADEPGFEILVEDPRCGEVDAVTGTPNPSRPSGTND